MDIFYSWNNIRLFPQQKVKHDYSPIAKDIWGTHNDIRNYKHKE